MVIPPQATLNSLINGTLTFKITKTHIIYYL